MALLSDSVTYDNMGRIRTGHSASGVVTNPTEDVTMMYHGLGSVIGMETSGSGGVATEAFTVNALGNRLRSWRMPTHYNDSDPATARIQSVNGNGQLLTVTSPKNDSTYATNPYFYEQDLDYDGVGNLSFSFMKEQGAMSGGLITMAPPRPFDAPEKTPFFTGSPSQYALGGETSERSMTERLMGPADASSRPGRLFTDSISQTAESHYYDGENHLRLFNRHNGIDIQSPSASNWAYEEYRYDALGRRVWIRARRWCDDTQGAGGGADAARFGARSCMMQTIGIAADA